MLLLASILLAGCASVPRPVSTAAVESAGPPPYDAWARVLTTYVDARGRVDFSGLAMIQSEPDAAGPASDPYMTAFALVLLRETGVPARDARLRAGVTWLKQNQRVSGRWWMKSLFRDTYQYITYISTVQALRALALCGEIPDLTGK